MKLPGAANMPQTKNYIPEVREHACLAQTPAKLTSSLFIFPRKNEMQNYYSHEIATHITFVKIIFHILHFVWYYSQKMHQMPPFMGTRTEPEEESLG